MIAVIHIKVGDMANPKRSWLDGPQIPAEFDGNRIARWPGEFLGLPKEGPGALASVMRRALGVAIDWIICLIAAVLITSVTDGLGGTSTVALILFFILGVVSVWLFARTPGQALVGIGVARIDARDAHVGFLRALARTAFTCFIFPAVLVDADGRGMHDRATGTAVVFG
ncbi:RDD family protein [Corynebacterium diphtheriae]|nr:RDD family protein [Corynebacterium diphtheriae]